MTIFRVHYWVPGLGIRFRDYMDETHLRNGIKGLRVRNGAKTVQSIERYDNPTDVTTEYA